jgi:hypothetical protein
MKDEWFSPATATAAVIGRKKKLVFTLLPCT